MLHLAAIAASLLPFAGCSTADRTTLEFRLAEDEAGPGLTEMVLQPGGEHLFLHDEVLLNESAVDTAVAVLHQGEWSVELRLNEADRARFASLTGENLGKRCAIVVNGTLRSAPRIMAPIRGGIALIANRFTERQARELARGLSERR